MLLCFVLCVVRLLIVFAVRATWRKARTFAGFVLWIVFVILTPQGKYSTCLAFVCVASLCNYAAACSSHRIISDESIQE